MLLFFSFSQVFSVLGRGDGLKVCIAVRYYKSQFPSLSIEAKFDSKEDVLIMYPYILFLIFFLPLLIIDGNVRNPTWGGGLVSLFTLRRKESLYIQR